MAAIPVTIQGVLFYSDAGVGGGPMPGGPSVSHPIAPGGPPLGYWGGVAPPHPDQGLPGQPPGIWPSPGHPSHPIAPGGRPPGIWGGAPPYPDQGLPGQPPYPSQGGPFPTNPIVLPPYIEGGPPVAIWPNPGKPTHPIVVPQPPPNPPEGAKPPPEDGGWGYNEWGWAYYPGPMDPSPKS